MSALVSHPTGNPNVRAVLRALQEAGSLHSFHTSISIPRQWAAMPFLSVALQHELERRVFPEIPMSKTVTRPYREAVRIVANRLSAKSIIRHETGFASVDRVYNDLDRHVAWYLAKHAANVRAIYAYEDGALYSFRAAHERGIKTIYDLPTAHWRTIRKILTEEQGLLPNWASTLEGLKDSAAKLAKKDEEISLADRIVVASAFTRNSLTDHFGDNISVDVVPYGAPPSSVGQPRVRLPKEPLRVFYAGRLRQSKGLAYIFHALKMADFPWNLILAGAKPTERCLALEQALKDTRCRWLGAIPHAKLLEEMTSAHVFVFPSLLEGFGLVILEAMAAGLPVITTPHTAGPDCIDDGKDGFIVPIRDAEAITCRLATLYDDEDRRFAMAAAALAKAGQLTWARYEEQIAALVAKTTA